MVYDPNNQRIILFGGLGDPLANDNWESYLLNDTWIYDIKANSWKLLHLDIKPDARLGHSMVYNPVSNKILLFGGVTSNDRVNDFWEFDSETQTWAELEQVNAPPVRSSSPFIYDSKNSRIILFGGYGAMNQKLDDMWGYSPGNSSWVEIVSDTKPRERYGHSMVYDSNNEFIILFGGNNVGYGKMDDTWIFDCVGNDWRELNLTTKPSRRYWQSMIYDAHNQISIIFGGRTGSSVSLDGSDETWKFDYVKNEWEKISTSSSPPARYDTPLVYDAKNHKAILFGGFDGDKTLNDVWELRLEDNNHKWTEIKESEESLLSSLNFIVLSSLLLLVVFHNLIKKRRRN
jgi:N-acetylneuraminic acid mutarotase